MIARKARPRKRRKTKTASLGRQADALWAQLVKRPGFCAICAKRESLQAAHGFSRRYRNTSYLLLNGFCLDASCHMRMTHNPLLWDQFLRDEWGYSVYDELRDLALRTTKCDVAAALAKLREEAERTA